MSEERTNANTKMNQILELSDKKFKTIIIKLIEQVLNPSSEVFYFLKTSLEGFNSRVETTDDRIK